MAIALFASGCAGGLDDDPSLSGPVDTGVPSTPSETTTEDGTTDEDTTTGDETTTADDTTTVDDTSTGLGPTTTQDTTTKRDTTTEERPSEEEVESEAVLAAPIPVPTESPPQPPIEIRLVGAPDPDAPPELDPPSGAELDLLDGVERALKRQAARVFYLDAPEGLRVGETSRVIVGLKRLVSLRLPPRARRLGPAAGKLQVEIAIHVYGDSAIEVEPRESRKTLLVDVRERTLDVRGLSRELGRFRVTPSDGGEHGLFLTLTRPTIEGRELAHEFEVPLRTVDVADEPLSDWLLGALMAASAVVGALGVLLKPVRAAILWLPQKISGRGKQDGRGEGLHP